jgi:YidC/Oxa1 family membrane protein insertase
MFQLLAGLLAYFYDLIPSYAFAITMLTFTVMLVLSPLTIKSTRNMLEMQRLQPELKKMQAKHKNDRQKLNEEMMAFYKEHKVNPVLGCVPMLLQMPIFIVMYRVIEGLTKIGPTGQPQPKYLSSDTKLYQDLVEDGGRMMSLGIDLAKSATFAHNGFGKALPYFVLVGLVVATQYFQTKQMTSRNPQAAAANPQMQMMTRVMPIFFGVISISIKAGVNIYFLASALFRIAQQELMYRFDPHIVRHHKAVREAAPIETKAKDVPKPAPPASGGTNGKGKSEPKGKATTSRSQASANRRKKRGR